MSNVPGRVVALGDHLLARLGKVIVAKKGTSVKVQKGELSLILRFWSGLQLNRGGSRLNRGRCWLITNLGGFTPFNKVFQIA